MNENDIETDEHLAWLADAIVRHLSNTVATYHAKTKPGEIEQFEGINERAAVAVLAKIFEGLGYSVYYEQQVFGNADRLDLWVGEPDGQARWYVEAKMMWEGSDNRLYRNKFGFQSDIDRLAKCSGENLEKVAIWFAFSPNEDLQRMVESKKMMGLRDAVDEVWQKSQAKLTHRSIDLDKFGPSTKTTRFAHIFCWCVV